MRGFRVEGQQLGAAQTETMAHPGECRHFGHATKLHSFKSHNTHEDPGFDDPQRISGVYHGGVFRHATRDHIHTYIYIYALMI